MDPNTLPVRTGLVRPICLDANSCPVKGREREQDNGERIINGGEAQPHAYPWMVRIIGINSAGAGWLCGGSIISPDYVLTAAHCVDGGTSFRIEAGSHDFSNTEQASRVTMGCSSCEIIHEEYSFPSNDIALIKVPTAYQFNDYIKPICISNYNVPVGSRGAAMGWGKTGDSASVSQTLQFVDRLKVISNEKAARVYGSNNINDGIICTRTLYLFGNKGTCQVMIEQIKVLLNVHTVLFLGGAHHKVKTPSPPSICSGSPANIFWGDFFCAF